MKRLRKTLLINLGIATTAIVLYSPGLFGLSLTGGAFASSMAVASGVSLLSLFFYENILLLKKPSSFKGLESSIEYLHEQDDIPFVKKTLKQYEEMETIEKTSEILLSKNFEKESVTYEKFFNIIRSSKKTIENNLEIIANYSLIFNDNPNMQYKMITSAKEVLDKNQIILNALNQLMVNLSDISDNGMEDSEVIIQEIEELCSQTKFYTIKEN